jgi:hypothetical protein
MNTLSPGRSVGHLSLCNRVRLEAADPTRREAVRFSLASSLAGDWQWQAKGPADQERHYSPVMARSPLLKIVQQGCRPAFHPGRRGETQ